MGIQINGNTNNINAGIGSLSIEDINELDIVGVATAANFKTGVSNLHSLGLTLSGGQLDVGSNIKIGTAGVITATSFAGSGANLTGVLSNIVEDTSPQLGGNLASNNKNILLPDSTGTNRIKFGTNEDLQIYHNGNNNKTYIGNKTSTDLLIENAGTNTDIVDDTGHYRARFIKDGAVELYHDNSKKLETQTNGTRIYDSLGIGADSTSDAFLSIRTPNGTSGSPSTKGGVIIRDGSYANGKLIDFQNSVGSSDISVDGSLNMNFANNHKIQLGDSQDLQIFHDGSDSFIKDTGTGALKVCSNLFRVNNAANSEAMIKAEENAGVTLSYDANTKFETTSSGVTVTGTCSATSFSGDGSNLTNLSTPLSYRNKIINGSMMVFQRGVGSNNYSGNHDGYYAGIADRWAIRAHSSMGTQTYDQNTNSPNNFANSQRIYTTGADGGNAGKYYVYDTRLEGQDLQDFEKGTSTAKSFTLSFYVKCNINRVFTCELRDLDNGRLCVQQYTTTNSNWNRYVLTFPADTTGKFDDDKNASLWVRFWLSAGANFKSGTSQTTWGSANDANICPGQTGDLGGRVGDYWYVTGVQLEVGDTATPFEQRTYADEFRRCARYCYQWIDDQQLGFGQVYSGSGYTKIFPPIPVNMRAKPSVTKNAPTGYWFVSYHGNSGYAGDRNVSVEGNSGDDNHQSANSFRIFVHGGSNQNNATTVWCLIHDTAGAYLRLEAEL